MPWFCLHAVYVFFFFFFFWQHSVSVVGAFGSQPRPNDLRSSPLCMKLHVLLFSAWVFPSCSNFLPHLKDMLNRCYWPATKVLASELIWTLCVIEWLPAASYISQKQIKNLTFQDLDLCWCTHVCRCVCRCSSYSTRLFFLEKNTTAKTNKKSNDLIYCV